MHVPIVDLGEPITLTDHVLGPPDAAVTVVEYGDFQCPRCRQAAGASKLLLARFASRVRLVFRHFPLEGVHPYALLAAEVAECAGAQSKFWEMHDMLFDHQDGLELVRLYGYAKTLHLDLARFTAELKNEAHLLRVREHLRRGQDGGIRSTPTFCVNGRIQDVSFGLSSLFEAVARELRSIEPQRVSFP